MKTVLHVGTFIIMAVVLFVTYVYVVPNFLRIFDSGVISIPITKHYLYDVFKYNTGLGVLGSLIYIILVLLMIAFSTWATVQINKSKNN